MNTYQRGTAINLVNRFWTLDPLTGDSVPADPSTVVFTIKDQNQVIQAFTFGIDPEVTNPEVGVYVCALDPQLPTGTYHYVCVGTGDVVAESEDEFEIVDSAVLPPEGPNSPVLGPCSPWISGQDVADCTQATYNDQPWLFDTVAYEAQAALFEISGRQFSGICTRVVRPCAQACSCWMSGPPSYGFGPFWWTSTPWGAGGFGWYNEAAGKYFGCAPLSTVRLGGYPVQEIEEVLIDGVVIPEFDAISGARNWRLDKWRDLVRMDTPPVAPSASAYPRHWPGCQNLALDADQPGTFQITYKWGADPPQIGRDAAVELANQLYLACGDGQTCSIPAGVTKIVRQGITIERGMLANWLNPQESTGLVATDLFLQAYCGGERRGRRSAVWSPDQQQMARKVGT